MKTTVFYDGQCSLCTREIAHYKKIAPKGVFTFIDITNDDHLFKQYVKDTVLGLKQLHVLDGEGAMHIGLNAFICLWQRLPRWRMLAVLAKLPGIHWLLSSLYRLFAAWRFKRNGYGQCKL